MKIQYRNFESVIQEDQIKGLLEELHQLIPKKLLVLTVRFEEGDNSARCSVNYDEVYLHAELKIYSCFFSNELLEQKRFLIHEFKHILFGELFNYLDSDIIQYVREHNEPLAEQFRRHILRMEEGIVEQLSHYILELHSGNKWN